MLNNLEGLRFGRMRVLSRAGSQGNNATWNCLCDCGARKVVRGAHLKSGRTASCGCFRNEIRNTIKATHGMARTSTYGIWTNMKSRCTNPNTSGYQRYGGRGIKVCQRWEIFENFLQDMGERPEGMTLERINTNNDYSPENCKWASWEEQQNNRSNTRMFTAFGKTQGLAQWARDFGIKYDALRYQIDKKGMTVEQAINMNLEVASEKLAASF